MDLIPAWLWFLAGLGLLVVEMNTATFFFGTVGFGALVASLVDFFIPGEISSFVAFVLATGFAAYMAWKFDIYSSSQETLKTGADRLIGETGLVEEEINPATGEGVVVVNGEKWRAESKTGEPIMEEEAILVKSVEGTSLVVDVADADNVVEGPDREEV